MAHGNLWVGSLPQGLDESSLREMFTGFGTIVSMKHVAERGYAFVKFNQAAEAEGAIASLNGAAVGGSNIIVRLANNDRGAAGAGGQGGAGGAGGGGYGKAASQGWTQQAAQAEPNANLYVKGLPPGMTDDSIRDTFGQHGTVVSVKVLNSAGVSSDGTGMTVALVRYQSAQEAAWAVENVNGSVLEGLTEPLVVKFATQGGGQKGGGGPYGGSGGGDQNGGQKGGGGLLLPNGSHVACAGKGGGQKGGGGPYGGSGGGDQNGGQKGGGGLLLPNGSHVACAGKGGGKSGWNGGQKGGGSGAGHAHLVPDLPAKIEHGVDHSNLYVTNLPVHADDLYLYKAFAPFGCVFSVKVVQRDTFAIGFVRYRSNEEAQNAIDNLNELALTDGVTLHVSVKTEKASGPTEQPPTLAANTGQSW